MVRSDIRTRARDYLYEDTANIFTDNAMNRAFDEEVRSLPKKDIYLETKYTTTLNSDELNYSLPSGTVKIEKVEVNEGTPDKPRWVPMGGWDTYGNKLVLSAYPFREDLVRIWIKKSFTIVTDDITALDIPDDVSELVVWGVVIRCYKRLIGYLRGSKSWDSVTKPGDLSIANIQSWLRDARREYDDLLKTYSDPPLPRDIGLVD